jgi:hypothetical protein
MEDLTTKPASCRNKKKISSLLSTINQESRGIDANQEKSERYNSPDVSEEEEDEDIEELIREYQEKRPRKFFQNTDDSFSICFLE